MNLNGYGKDNDGIPLSIASLRSNLLTGEDVHLVANLRRHDWTAREFMDALRSFPVEWYALNNRALYFESDRRFGAFNRVSSLLGRLPAPLDRALDNVLGDRDRRLVVGGKIQIAGLLTVAGARLAPVHLLCDRRLRHDSSWGSIDVRRETTQRRRIPRPQHHIRAERLAHGGLAGVGSARAPGVERSLTAGRR